MSIIGNPIIVGKKPEQAKTVSPATSQQIVTPDSGKVLSSVTVNAAPLQAKTVTPTTSQQIITPDSGQYGLSSVTVNAAVLQEKTVTPTASGFTVSPDSGKYGLSSVKVNGNSNLVAGNIKSGVTIFGVTGSYAPVTSAIIITGLKSTDTVTCIKDGKSYAATWDDTANHWEIVGLPLGTFTVTATDGKMVTTETVLIDITGVYEVEMVFKLWLYRYGDECEDVTGGWVDASTNNGGCFVTSNAIDFANFIKFCATFMRNRSDTYAYRGHFEVGDTRIIGPSTDGYNEYITRSADITSITGSKSVRAIVQNSNSTVYKATKNNDNLHLYTYQRGYCDAHLYVKEIWMERGGE